MNRALRYRFVGAAVTAVILLSTNGTSARPRAKNPGPAHEQKTVLTREQIRLCNGKNGASADLRIEACTAVIAANTKKISKPDAYLVRAAAYRDKGDKERAIADFGEAIKLKSKGTEAYYGRGMLLRDTSDLDGAATDLEQVVRLDKRNI